MAPINNTQKMTHMTAKPTTWAWAIAAHHNKQNKVRVYFNFHKKLFSVQEKVDGRWKVVNHTNTIYLHNVSFKVSEAGRQRVLREKKKNVHAFIEGERLPFVPSSFTYDSTVTYNPYKNPTFTISNHYNKPIDKAKYVAIVDGMVRAFYTEYKGEPV